VDQVRVPDVLGNQYDRHDSLNDTVPVSTKLHTKQKHYFFFMAYIVRGFKICLCCENVAYFGEYYL